MEARRRKTTTEQLIDTAVQAGSLWEAARIYPEARGGLERAAAWHSARAATLAEELGGVVSTHHQPPPPGKLRTANSP